MNWNKLKSDISKYSIRNKSIVAEMPKQSTSILMNFSSGIEPIRNPIITKTFTNKQILDVLEKK